MKKLVPLIEGVGVSDPVACTGGEKVGNVVALLSSVLEGTAVESWVAAIDTEADPVADANRAFEGEFRKEEVGGWDAVPAPTPLVGENGTEGEEVAE